MTARPDLIDVDALQKEEDLRQAEKVYHDLWKDLVEKRGKVDMNQVKLELLDFYKMMQEVPKVYSELTGGEISKPLTPAGAVITHANDYMQECIFEDFMDRGGLKWKKQKSQIPCKLFLTAGDGCFEIIEKETETQLLVYEGDSDRCVAQLPMNSIEDAKVVASLIECGS